MKSEPRLDTAERLARKACAPLRAFIASATPEQLVLLIAVPALLIAAPWILGTFRLLTIAVSTGISAIVLYGLALLYGQIGILSIGHGALWGVGAYFGVVLSAAGRTEAEGLGPVVHSNVPLTLDWSFWAILPLAGLGAAIVAGALVLPALRGIRGHHFVILSFAFAEIFTIAVGNGGALTGQFQGRILDDRVSPVLGLTFKSLESLYFLVLFFLFIAMVALFLITRSGIGRTSRAVRENEPLAQSLGINVNAYKIGVFMLSGVFAGVSGLLYAYFLRHVSPDLFGAFPGIQLVLMMLVGGATWLLGPLAGAVVIGFLPEVTDAVGFGLNFFELRILYSFALLAVIILLPQGLVSGIASGYALGKGQIMALLRPRAPMELTAESAEDPRGDGANPSPRER